MRIITHFLFVTPFMSAVWPPSHASTTNEMRVFVRRSVSALLSWKSKASNFVDSQHICLSSNFSFGAVAQTEIQYTQRRNASSESKTVTKFDLGCDH